MPSISVRFKVFIRSVSLAIPLLAISAPLLLAQTNSDQTTSTGSFNALATRFCPPTVAVDACTSGCRADSAGARCEVNPGTD